MTAFPIPTNEAEFHTHLGDEDSCRRYLISVRWPDGFVCPRCACKVGYGLKNREKWECAACKYHCSIRAGTVMQGSKKPLSMWFAAMYYMVESKQGFSALGLMRRLNLRSYQTAWTWFQKLRDYLTPEPEPIVGRCEADEFYIGGKAKGSGVRGRGSPKKVMVACVVECTGRGSGRVRFKVMKDGTADSLTSFVRAVVGKGSTLQTDANPAYDGLAGHGYVHDKVTSEDEETVSSHLPRMFRVGRLVKGMMSQTHMGAVSPWRLQKYLDEYAFRFERKKAPARFVLFDDLFKAAVKVRCRTCRAIMADRDPDAGGVSKKTGEPRGRKIAERGAKWWQDLLPLTPWPAPGAFSG